MTETVGRAPDDSFGPGPSDLVLVPLAAAAVALRRLARALLTLLIHLLDYAFAILLQVMRFPLFTVRILGDGVVWLSRAIVSYLPVGGGKREAWREAIARHWAWVRKKISYKAFEEAVHHAFEGGMAWVFKRCKTLTPGRALLVLALAVLWFPISFVAATALHAVLFAKATTWPAWTQLLHPLATILAKTKLLVLPVYPAAWPQANNHPAMQAMFAAWRSFAATHVVRKLCHRTRQLDAMAERATLAIDRGASQIGLQRGWAAFLAAINSAAVRVRAALHAVGMRAIAILSRIPVMRTVVAHYAEHYERASEKPNDPLSERVGDFVARWSVKFTAEYYEAKEKAEAAKRNGGAT